MALLIAPAAPLRLCNLGQCSSVEATTQIILVAPTRTPSAEAAVGTTCVMVWAKYVTSLRSLNNCIWDFRPSPRCTLSRAPSQRICATKPVDKGKSPCTPVASEATTSNRKRCQIGREPRRLQKEAQPSIKRNRSMRMEKPPDTPVCKWSTYQSTY